MGAEGGPVKGGDTMVKITVEMDDSTFTLLLAILAQVLISAIR